MSAAASLRRTFTRTFISMEIRFIGTLTVIRCAVKLTTKPLTGIAKMRQLWHAWIVWPDAFACTE